MARILIFLVIFLFLSCAGSSFAQNKSDTLKGTLNGPYEVKSEDGRILLKGTFAYGIRTGDWEIWDREHVFCQYKDGVLNGYYKEMVHDKIHYEWNYKNGKRNGLQKDYHSGGGNVRYEYEMVNDLLEGNYKEYHPDGKLQREQQFKAGKRHGKSTRYRDDGTKYFDIEFKNGVANGIFIEYDNKGLVKSKGNMVNGKKDGNWEYYENGKLDETAVYKDGVVISGKDVGK
jgi:antitoxin component YwqK of YwqJK toxin-antitoxin module